MDRLYRKFIKNLLRCRRGAVMVEMAIISPILILMILASADIVSYMLANQKMARAAYTVSNLITQMDQGLTEGQVADMLLALGEVSKPFDLAGDGKATITAIVGVGTDGVAPDSYQVAWKRCYGHGTVTGGNSYGDEGDTVPDSEIPENTIVMTSQVLIISDIVYNFTPIVGILNLDTRMAYSSFFRPRLGSIETIIADGFTAPSC